MAHIPPVHKRLGGSRSYADRACRGQVFAAQIVFSQLFGRMDFRIDVSGAKFHEEIDFDV